jgi:hypothetical protein
MKFFDKVKQKFVHILSCCDEDEEPIRAVEIVSLRIEWPCWCARLINLVRVIQQDFVELT